MKVEQIYTNCLFQGSYVIESEGEIAIIDPLREPNQYIKKAKETNSKIKYIFETHIHADFVSGHLTLSKLTGAPIIFGPKAEIEYDCIIAEDFQEFKLGKISLQILHTPGHTLESCTILLKNHRNEKVSIFTGDTLFLGDVGRPDLSQWCPSRKSSKLNQNELAAMLFDSLRNKIMPLPDNLIVYPAHGAGSACGKNMMKETYDTLGNQKKVNYALREDMSKSEFIEEVLNGLESPPEYFPMNVKMNQTGYEDLSDIFKKSLVEINPIEFDELSKKNNHLVLDVRNENDYVRGHIPKSIFIGLNGSFAPWVGTLIKNVEKPILLVAPLGKEKEAITRLSRVGFDNVIGYLKGGFENWKLSQKRTDKIISLNAKDLNKDNNEVFYDVRNISELQSGKLKNSFNLPLDFIQNKIEDFPKNEPFYVHCAGGYRSVIAISLLKSNGIHNAIDIKGGFAALKKSEFQII